MVNQIISEHSDNFQKSIEHFEIDLSGVRTGRANPGLLVTVQVDSYGSKMPLTNVATVAATDSKTLTITPWDKSLIPSIEKGIQVANLGLTPSSDGQVIRISLPSLTEERRKEMVKLIGNLTEKARISIRGVREDILKAVKKAESDGKVSKDDVVFAQKKVQEKVDQANEKIKQLAELKEKEVMTV
jgi:ribosome recycling factor